MKKNLLLILLLLTTGLVAKAEVFEVNQFEKSVYIHPTPVLEVELVDLEEEGGMLTASINYETSITNAEIEQLQKDYPDYTIKPLFINVKPNQLVNIVIADIGINESVNVKQGQFGPYLNFQKLISKAQTMKFKSLHKQINGKTMIEIVASAHFSSKEEVESYSLSSDICKTLNVASVKDLVLQFSKMTVPKEIKYKETFDSLKENLLKKCFLTNQTAIGSFKELLNVRVFTSAASFLIKGEFVKTIEKQKEFVLRPSTLINIK